jgi:hypothetical protein
VSLEVGEDRGLADIEGDSQLGGTVTAEVASDELEDPIGIQSRLVLEGSGGGPVVDRFPDQDFLWWIKVQELRGKGGTAA